ncbi:MAG: hypothetical protein P8178_14095, partial [Candidatus Thiodiazotropha sp.]
RISAARLVTARVGEGLTAFTRLERCEFIAVWIRVRRVGQCHSMMTLSKCHNSQLNDGTESPDE